MSIIMLAIVKNFELFCYNKFLWFCGYFCGHRWQKLELPDCKFQSA